MVLVIDDDPGMREVAQEMLRSFGWDVVTAEDGKRGIKALKKHREKITVVLTDILMPEADGLDVISYMRRKSSSIPVIAMSGGSPNLSSGFNLKIAKEMGAWATIQKPFLSAELYSILRAFMVKR